MALTTVALVQQLPTLRNVSQAWLETLVSSADKSIKQFLKWPVEQATYTHYFSGKNQQELILKNPWVTSITNLWVDANGNWGRTSGAFGSGRNN
jgi:hypothetical protein